MRWTPKFSQGQADPNTFDKNRIPPTNPRCLWRTHDCLYQTGLEARVIGTESKSLLGPLKDHNSGPEAEISTADLSNIFGPCKCLSCLIESIASLLDNKPHLNQCSLVSFAFGSASTLTFNDHPGDTETTRVPAQPLDSLSAGSDSSSSCGSVSSRSSHTSSLASALTRSGVPWPLVPILRCSLPRIRTISGPGLQTSSVFWPHLAFPKRTSGKNLITQTIIPGLQHTPSSPRAVPHPGRSNLRDLVPSVPHVFETTTRFQTQYPHLLPRLCPSAHIPLASSLPRLIPRLLSRPRF